MAKTKTAFELVLSAEEAAVKLTEEQAALLFTDEERKRGESRGKLKTVGMWQIPFRYTALCTAQHFDDSVYPTKRGPLHVYGKRTLSRIREEGYHLEGRVSVKGKERRAFTSSQLFELPDGKLLNAATIHACGVVEE